MYKHGFAPPPALVLPGGLAPPPGLGDIIARLMAKKPADRFQTPQELIDALLAIRPGSAGGENPGYASVAVPAGPADGTGPWDDFGNLTGGDELSDTPLPRPLREAGAGVSRGWVVFAALALLFGLGFLAAALIFSSRRR
jgi:hypothetical protein